MSMSQGGTYSCNLCGYRRKVSDLVGFRRQGGKINLADAARAGRHLCTTCARLLVHSIITAPDKTA